MRKIDIKGEVIALVDKNYTIYKMMKNGMLMYFKSGNGKKSHYRIPESELERMQLMNIFEKKEIK